MTHTSHRRGDRESLEGDYVILSRMERYPLETQEKMRTLVKICAKHNTVGMRIFDKDRRSIRYMKGWDKSRTAAHWYHPPSRRSSKPLKIQSDSLNYNEKY